MEDASNLKHSLTDDCIIVNCLQNITNSTNNNFLSSCLPQALYKLVIMTFQTHTVYGK
jgi:hypothetical protein